MKILKRYNILLFLTIHILFAIFIRNTLFPIHFTHLNFFFLDLIGIKVLIPFQVLLLLDCINLILIWLISKKVFKTEVFVVPLIYALIPWSSYLIAGESFYIYLLFLLLLTFYGLALIKSNKLWGSVLVTLGITTAMYDSMLLLFLLPAILLLIIFFKLLSFNSLKAPILISILLLLPLTFLIYKNQLGFRNILTSEIKIFSDPGLLNMVNNYQGAAKQEGFSKLAKISENKYIFTVEYVLLKYLKQLTPPTYFTQQEKLLNFSFSSPMYLGFFIPFLYGLYQALKSAFLRKILFISSLLVVPSVLAKEMVDLNRLIIFAPVVILVTSYGVLKLYEQRKKTSFFLILTLILVIFQFLVTLSDIHLREKDRYVKYFGQNYEIGK